MITSHHITAQLAAERQRELRAAGPARHRWVSPVSQAFGGGTPAADERLQATAVRPRTRRAATDQPPAADRHAAAHSPELRARRSGARVSGA